MNANAQMQKKFAIMGIVAVAIVALSALIKLPMPFDEGGYISLGNSAVFVGAYLLGPFLGTVVAVISCLLGDLLAGSPDYVTVTIFVKGVMALIAGIWLKKLSEEATVKELLSPLVIASTWMLAGYFIFELTKYGLGLALGGIVFRVIEAAICILVAIPVMNLTSQLKQVNVR